MRWFRALIPALAGFTMIAPAHAGVELVTNGGFEQTSLAGSYQMDGSNVTGWSTHGSADSPLGYNFLYYAGTATTTGAYTPQYNNTVKLWGAANAGASTWDGTSVRGGNFIGADGAFETYAISQSINGLTIGQKYDLNFWYAGAQQSGFSGATTEGWQVSLGAQTLSSTILNNPTHGFTGWFQQTLIFTATASTQTLSFLALGTPSGQPPFSLLDDVSLQQDIPEPATWALLGMGAFGLLCARLVQTRRMALAKRRS